MSRNIHRLTDRQVRNANKPINDGGNLWMYPKGNARSWIFRYMLNGRAREMGLGAFPDVSIARARESAHTYRGILKSGVDPIDYRNTQARIAAEKAQGIPTFTQVAARYIRAHRHGWGSFKHSRQWARSISKYARPIIGSKPVDQLGTEDILSVLRPIWISKTTTANRLRGRLENILDFAAVRQWREPLNPARWRGHLDMLLPRPGKIARISHYPAMPYTDVPAFMAELSDRPGIPALALRFLILTAARSGEVIGSTWDEIDLEERVWSIPASRMKSGRPHRVPLPAAAVEILWILPRVNGNPHVFPGTIRDESLSEVVMLRLMQRMGYGATGSRGHYVPHGFRSAFRDWVGETTSFPRDVCEMALAHAIESRVEAAYRRGDLFAKRTAMMEQWADWCGRGDGAKIIQLRETRADVQ